MVQGLVGVGHIEVLIQQRRHQGGGDVPAAPDEEFGVRALSPDVLFGHDAFGRLRRVPRPGADVVVGQQGEGRNDVLPEVLVLVVADDQQRIGPEAVELTPEPVEAVDQRSAVTTGGGQTFVVSPLGPHRLRPATWAAELLGDVRIVQGPSQGGRKAGIGVAERREMGETHAEHCPHVSLPPASPPTRRAGSRGPIASALLNKIIYSSQLSSLGGTALWAPRRYPVASGAASGGRDCTSAGQDGRRHGYSSDQGE